jgi:PTS system fructose-specific IIC component/PTS system nitrogen regulatory IIA component
MFLSDVFRPEFIKVGLEAEDKEEVFEELVDQFCQAAKLQVREDILGALKEREAKMSTGIHQGIAIPHGSTNAIDHVCGALGISRKGVDYDALDGKPVYLFFMLLAPPLESEKHLRLLKRVAGLLDNPQFYTDLVAQNDAQGAYVVIKKYEDMFITLD